MFSNGQEQKASSDAALIARLYQEIASWSPWIASPDWTMEECATGRQALRRTRSLCVALTPPPRETHAATIGGP